MGRELKRVLIEPLVVAALGLLVALAANLVSPRGLSLTRDYFPGAQAGGSPSGNGQTNSHGAAMDVVAARLRAKGLQPINGSETGQLFHDPQYEQELIVFVDARDDRHYEEGHVPGAYQFDRYYPQNHLLTVLPPCLNALKVVVYCAGGNCEDSEFAALALKEAGVPSERLFVFAGGMTEWTQSGLPIEVGASRSGNLRSAKP